MPKRLNEPSQRQSCSIRPVAFAMLFFSLAFQATRAEETVGVIKFARGDVTIESRLSEPRKARNGDQLARNDLIVTGAKAVAVIELTDESRMTLRPFSEFRIDRLNLDRNTGSTENQSGAILNLLRGGLRLVTGLIGKINPSEYRLVTPVATIGIRGTEFNTRLCDADCAAEESRLAGSDAADRIEEGLYVNVDDGRVFLENDAAGEAVDLSRGESGYVSDLNSLPIKLSFVPAFQSLDLLPSPSQLDLNNIQMPDDFFPGLDSSVEAVPEPADAENKAEEAVAENTEKEEAYGISGNYKIDVHYGADLPLSDRRRFFGSDPDIIFTLVQKEDRFGGKFSGDRDGTIEGKVDGNLVTFNFLLDASGGELKEGTGTWRIGKDGSLKGDFQISDSRSGLVRGHWTLTRTNASGSAAMSLEVLLALFGFTVILRLFRFVKP